MFSSLKPLNFGAGSVEVGPEAKPGESRARRNALWPDSLTSNEKNLECIYDILTYSARNYGTQPAIGYREIVDVHVEEKDVKKTVDGKDIVEKKKWEYFQLSEYKYINFIQLKDMADSIGRGLIDLGLKRGDVLNIYSSTRYARADRLIFIHC
jgi:long-chain acyl-CoA synthetase